MNETGGGVAAPPEPPLPTATPLRVALYARTGRDQAAHAGISDPGIERQLEVACGYACCIGGRVVGRFVDAGRSGATIAGRQGLAAVLAEVRGGAVDVLVVEALHRLSRSQDDLRSVLGLLRSCGVELHAVGIGLVAERDALLKDRRREHAHLLARMMAGRSAAAALGRNRAWRSHR